VFVRGTMAQKRLRDLVSAGGKFLVMAEYVPAAGA